MITRHPLIIILTLTLIGLNGCTKQVPVASFSVDEVDIRIGESVSFTDQSINEPTSWEWTFIGGTPESSSMQNPTVTYHEVGTYDVSLVATNGDGSDYVIKENIIAVNKVGTDITFLNTTYTDITIQINGVEKIIPPDGEVSYYDLTGSSVDYTAWTSGQTSEGTQVGYLLNWGSTIEFYSSQITRTLLVSDDYYCLFIRNNGTESFTSLQVGILDILTDFTADRTEDILIPNDNKEYRIGYYKSYTATGDNWIQIRAHSPSWYVYWSQGWQFSLPDTSNQSIHLFSEIKKGAAESQWKDPGDPENYLYPDHAIRLEDP